MLKIILTITLTLSVNIHAKEKVVIGTNEKEAIMQCRQKCETFSEKVDSKDPTPQFNEMVKKFADCNEECLIVNIYSHKKISNELSVCEQKLQILEESDPKVFSELNRNFIRKESINLQKAIDQIGTSNKPK